MILRPFDSLSLAQSLERAELIEGVAVRDEGCASFTKASKRR